MTSVATRDAGRDGVFVKLILLPDASEVTFVGVNGTDSIPFVVFCSQNVVVGFTCEVAGSRDIYIDVRKFMA
jgi:hypothetical protein